MSRLARLVARTTLGNLIGCLGLAFAFWAPMYGGMFLALAIIAEAVRSAFPPATSPTDQLAKRLDEVEARLGRVELRSRA